MKNIGFILISIGLALMLFIFYNFIKEKNKMTSPIPDNKGVRIILISPTK